MKQISDKAYQRFQAMCEAAGIEPTEEVTERWTPQKQKYFFTPDGDIRESIDHCEIDIGRERSTKSLCKIASDRTIRANRISAWLDSEGSGEQEYSAVSENSYILLNANNKFTRSWTTSYYPDVVYMLKEDAIKLCEALNDGLASIGWPYTG